MKTIGERIRQARESRGMSQQQLAEAVGFSHQSAIANLENRATGRGGFKLPEIARALETSVEWLLNGPDSEQVPAASMGSSPITATHEVRDRVATFHAPTDIDLAIGIIRKLPRKGVTEALEYLRFLEAKHDQSEKRADSIAAAPTGSKYRSR